MWSMRRNQSAKSAIKMVDEDDKQKNATVLKWQKWEREPQSYNCMLLNLQFCEEPEWAWKWVLPRASNSRYLDLALGDLEQRNQVSPPAFWPTELWGSKWVLFRANVWSFIIDAIEKWMPFLSSYIQTARDRLSYGSKVPGTGMGCYHE